MKPAIRKTAIIYRADPSVWQSARTIRRNLVSAYRRALPRADIFEISYKPDSIQAAVSSLVRGKYSLIVIPESMPVPARFIQALSETAGYRPEIHIHLYGDFSLNTLEWSTLDKALRKFRVRFYVASHAQAGMVSEFLKMTGPRGLEICPFPVDETRFHFQKTGNLDRIRTLIYSGRISRQKGVFLMLDWIARVRREEVLPPFRVQFAGVFDDLGGPLWGESDPAGYSFSLWREGIEKNSLNDVVAYLGNLNESELISAYAEADAYVSLSLYHDEDYGMAPAEALTCGTPCILSAWGGFASFALRDGDVHLCPTRITKSGITISYSDFKAAFIKILRNPEIAEERPARARFYGQNLGISAIAGRLSRYHLIPAPRFQGFRPLIQAHSKRIVRGRTGSRVYDRASQRDPIYFRLYRHYTSMALPRQ